MEQASVGINTARTMAQQSPLEHIKKIAERMFADARKIFSRLNAEGDNPSGIFETRCEQFIKEHPPPEWNGIWVMQRK